MKYLIAFALLTSIANAKESCSTVKRQSEALETYTTSTDVPNHLKGAFIIVRRADGRESAVPAELFKVVPRKQERIVSRMETTISETCKEFGEHRNRVSLLAGYGTKGGLSKSISPSKVEVETKTGVVGGLQYQRLLTEKFSIGVQGQSNNTGSLMIGLDF